MYKIIGADQKVYGPVSAELLKQWIKPLLLLRAIHNAYRHTAAGENTLERAARAKQQRNDQKQGQEDTITRFHTLSLRMHIARPEILQNI